MKTGKNIFWAFGMAMAIFAASGCRHSSCRSCTTVRTARKSTMNKFARILATATSLPVGENGGHPMVIWLNRLGESILSRKFPAGDFAKITNVFPLAGRQSAAGRLPHGSAARQPGCHGTRHRPDLQWGRRAGRARRRARVVHHIGEAAGGRQFDPRRGLPGRNRGPQTFRMQNFTLGTRDIQLYSHRGRSLRRAERIGQFH